MRENPNIWAITGDLGFGGFDQIREDFPDRFLNTGAAEVAMMDIAVGLALSGKIPVVYSITPFLLYRPFEVLRTYINHEEIPVIMVGSGRDKDYAHDGFSHDASDDRSMSEWLRNIDWHWPQDTEEMMEVLLSSVLNPKPTYINLVR